MREQQSDLY